MVQINKPHNILDVATHVVLSAGLVAASLLIAQPWMVVTMTAVSAALSHPIKKAARKLFSDKLQEYPASLPESPNLGKIAEELYRASGLSADKYPIYDFKPDDKKLRKETNILTHLFGAVFKMMGDTYNAAANSDGKPTIMISRPLLALLNDDEEKAVLAHEFAHAAARHTNLKTPQGLLASVASGAANLGKLVTQFSMGFVPVLTAVLGSIASAIATRFVIAKQKEEETNLPFLKVLLKDDKDMSFRQMVENKKAERKMGLIGNTVSLAIYTAFSPAFAGVWGIAKGISMAAKVLKGSLSRSFEFQADRGATQLGANPLALVTGLRKIAAVNKQSLESAYEGPLPKDGFLRKMWKKATASHPDMNRRINRLCEIARKSGYSPEAIEEARNGEIKIDPKFNMQPDVLRYMVG